MSSAATTAPASKLVGTLTVRVIKCRNLEKKRLIGKMNPYVKLDVGSDEKFKTKPNEGGDQNPQWDQSFLFNLNGQTDLHIKIYDSELLSDAYVGRADLPIMALLEAGGGEAEHDVHDPDNFRKISGHIFLSITFNGTGGPAATQEKAPISGPFHFQHNSTGFLLHVVGEQLQLRAGGMNDPVCGFEFQGPYIRYLPDSRYLTAMSDTIIVKPGISEDAKFRWLTNGLQHAQSNKMMHPENDSIAMNTKIVLAAGTTAASGFSLIPCSGQPVSPITPPQVSTPQPAVVAQNPPAQNPHAIALPPMENLHISPQPQQVHSPEYPNLAGPVVVGSPISPSWHCAHCTFENSGGRNVCEMCSKSKSVAQVASPVFDLHNTHTFPASLRVKNHPHPLFLIPRIYEGTYNCDLCTKSGQGHVYHCEPCKFDAHPKCAHDHLQH